MKSIMLAIVLLVSSASMASDTGYAKYADQEMKFTFTSNRSYYSCSYAKAQTKKYLNALEAKDIKIRCSGGIENGTPSWTWSSIFIQASFQALETADSSGQDTVMAAVKTAKISGRDACDINVRLFEATLSYFDSSVMSKSHNCFDSKGSYRYDFSTLKAL